MKLGASREPPRTGGSRRFSVVEQASKVATQRETCSGSAIRHDRGNLKVFLLLARRVSWFGMTVRGLRIFIPVS